MLRFTQTHRFNAVLVRFVAVAFGVFAISATRLYAQETLLDSKPWPPDPTQVSAACEGQQVFNLFNPWNTANAEEIADLALRATKDAAHLTSCYEAHPHPKYVLWRAFFEVVAAQGYFYRSDYVDGNRYLELARSDLRFVSKYANLPANFENALTGNLRLEGMVERQAETRSTVLSRSPLGAPNGQEGSAGLPWPPNPSSVSVECGKDNEANLTNATISAVSNKLYPEAITAATKGMAQMTACIDAYGHPEYFLYRAFFEGTAAGTYSMQRDVTNSVRYLRLAESDLRHLSMYTGLPDEVLAKLQAAQRILQTAGNIGHVGSSDSYSLHAVSCAAIAQRPPNEFWIAMAQSGLAPVPRPETLLGVTFENTAQVALTDLRVHYDFLDAFGDIIASLDGVWSGSFASNTVINFGGFGTFGIKDLGLGGAIEKPPLVNASQVKNVSCYVSGARWSDGTVRSYTASSETDGENAQAPM
jgi:hypothetical protein